MKWGMPTRFCVLCGVLMLVSVAVIVRAVDLPDPLEFADGSKVTSVKAWEEKRRDEVLELFREHVYGRNAVERPADLRFEPLEEETDVFEGSAVRRRVRIAYAGTRGESSFTLIVYYPAKGVIKGCFLMIVNRSSRIITQAEVMPVEFWPVQNLIERGYATAAFYNGDVAPDRKEGGFTSGAFSVFGPEGEPRAGDAWGVIAAWAWGASRALDYLQEQPRLKGVPLAVAGHSRGGKAALWCGAQDRRVAMAVSNDSGTAGAALARVSTGESVRKINTTFPHWFAVNYHSYNDREAELPVDQHALIGLIAPRLAYVASAADDVTACPRAEFQSCVEAARVYALYGLKGVGAEFPEAGKSFHDGAIGYHLRAGEHDLKREDWARFMDFADARFPELRKK
jgi:hypothetical protein